MISYFFYILARFSDDPLIQKALQIEQKSHNLAKFSVLNLTKPLQHIDNIDFDIDNLAVSVVNTTKIIGPKTPLKIYLRQKEIFVNNTYQKLRFSFWTFLTDLFHTMSGFPYDFKVNDTLGWTLPSNSGNFTFLLSKNEPRTMGCLAIQNNIPYDCLPKEFRIDAFTDDQRHIYSPNKNETYKFRYYRNKETQLFPVKPLYDIIGFRIIVYSNQGSNTTTCLNGLKVYPTC